MPDSNIPEWVTETLPEHTYLLGMFANNDYSCQEVELTRAEFIALKYHLAVTRGYIPERVGVGSAVVADAFKGLAAVSGDRT